MATTSNWHSKTTTCTILHNFSSIIDSNPRHAAAYNGRGLVREKLGDNKAATSDFTAAIELDPSVAAYWYNRGCSLYTSQEFSRSLHDFAQAVAMDKDNPAVYASRGLVYCRLRRFAEACCDFAQEIALRKEVALEAYNNRAYCFAQQAEFAKAIEDYSYVLSIDKENVHALHNRGLLYLRTKDFGKALNDFTVVLEKEPENGSAQLNVEYCLEQLGETRELSDISKNNVFGLPVS